MQSFLQSHPSPPGFANFFRILSFSLLPPLDTYWQVVYCVLLNWHVSQSVCLFTEVDKLVLFWQWETLFLCLSALVQSLVYFVIASLSVIWRREVVTLQPLSVFSLFSVFFFISLSPASLLWSKLFLMLSNWHHCSHFYLSFCL